ncbi:hypothetical protein ACFQX7_37800 [Luedemannella flava]
MEALTGTAAPTFPERERQVLAARAVWAATGDPAPTLPTVRAVLAAGERPASSAAEYVADLVDRHRAAVVDFKPLLLDLLREPWGSVAAARALWRLGTPPADLVDALLASVTRPWGARGAIPLLVEMGAAEAAPGLEQLAERDERVVIAGTDDDVVWQDELLQARLRAAVDTLRGAG